MARTRREHAAARERRHVRTNATALEDGLWQAFRSLGGGVAGLFRRQERIGPFLLDFVSDRLSLIIEVDGAQHRAPGQRLKDEARDRWLAGEGYRVLRFSNVEVRAALPAVLDTIFAVVEERKALPPAERPRHPQPPHGKPRPRPRR